MTLSVVTYRGVQLLSTNGVTPLAPGSFSGEAGGDIVQFSLKELSERIGPCNTAVTNPGVTNDGIDTASIGIEFEVGSLWWNTTLDIAFMCLDKTTGAAVWKRITAGLLQGVDNTYDIRPADEGPIAGNARGINSVDLQTIRANATHVASGDAAVVGGGENNAAGSDYSVVGGGETNSVGGASSDHSVVSGGENNVAAGSNTAIGGGFANVAGSSDFAQTIAGGSANTTASDWCTVGGGYSNHVQSSYGTVAGGNDNAAVGLSAFIGGGESNETSSYATSVAGGLNNSASGDYSSIPGGEGNNAAGQHSVASGKQAKALVTGQNAHASGQFATVGDAQASKYVIRRQVTHSDANWYELTPGGTASPPRLTILNSTTWTFEVKIVGTDSGTNKSFGFIIHGVIERASDDTTTLLTSTELLHWDGGGTEASFDARVSADNTNNALMVEVQDLDGFGDTVRWVAVVETVEVTFPT
jgi:hypothetical protein